ncbi:preprotein translocase subunit SecE [bacterium]|jgi:preprotein translocase SecE subunit|nr:preprotein translocase subunit SecE [bacterium]
MNEKVTTFLKDVKYEMLSKVHWSTIPELKVSTYAVGIVSLILAVYIYGADQIFDRLFRAILGQ